METNVVGKIKSAFNYNPETGDICWSSPGHGRRIGVPCGTIRTNKNGRKHREIKVDGVSYTAARIAWIIMTGKIPDFDIIAKDGNSLNTAWDNLANGGDGLKQRLYTGRKHNTSGQTGVCPSHGQWEAYIGDGKGGKQYLGIFPKKSQAIRRRLAAERERGYSSIHSLAI